ncbi:tRNA (adenine(37)-N6)-methyltransferase-like [Diaphorina citri]|uniref:tRNA (Adenine(37)-N6)-methyltransferase-like n=1 Tax=Diaphorina citri TaxID=121845 RepID=A0A3Q0J6G9_DIACI|nr:tRNA (adenine(37)-N6)-methyltransferase-like [Diaphorina citri]
MANRDHVDRQRKIEDINHQLKVARSEMNNLRTQLQNLTHAHHKQVKELQHMLKNIKIKIDQDDKALTPVGDNKSLGDAGTSIGNSGEDEDETANLPYKCIGTISTRFKAKRGIPRQATICLEKKGKITLAKSVFTNPEHSLEGLQDFSHMWIIFHFHKNVESTHIKAKVSPPRLDGSTVGVFSTRSPYRPTPIGLSLVTIDKIEGVETQLQNLTHAHHKQVKELQHMLKNIVSQLNVVFEDRARSQLESIAASDPCKETSSVETTIRNILREDPRSVYVRKRFKNQFYTFQIDSLHVSCKFNDDEKSVLVYRVNKGDSLDLEDSQAFEF